MKRILFLSAFLSFAATPVSFAQSLRTVEGKVTDDNGAPMEGVVITVKNYEASFCSDANGNFSLKIPYEYNYISAEYPDYKSVTVEIDGSYLTLKLKYDAAGVKSRAEASLKARRKAEIKAKDDRYDERFKNKGLLHSIDFGCSYEFSGGNILYRYSGYRSYGNLFPMQLTYTLSYKFNRLVSLGVGAGALYNAKSITIINDSFEYPNRDFVEKRLDVPVFLNLKVNMLRTWVRPYVSLSGGYYIFSETPMGEGGLGCEIRFARSCAFRIQASAGLMPWPWILPDSPAKYIPTFNTGLKVGFDF